MNKEQKTMLLNITLAAMESVRAGERPGSARETRMTRSMDRVRGLVDCYRLEPWPRSDIALADALVDEFNGMIHDEFGDKRDDKMTLHIGLAAFEIARAHEDGAVRTRLGRGLDAVLGFVRIYDIESVPPAQVNRAGKLGDRFNARIAEVFGNGRNNCQHMPAM